MTAHGHRMTVENGEPAPIGEIPSDSSSRRHALALMLGVVNWLPAVVAADGGVRVRFALSESLMGDVNMNDARAAMTIWLKRMTQEIDVVIDPKVFISTQEMVERTRTGQLDALALNIVEYRQIADLLDSSQIITAAGGAGMQQYVILAKQNGGIRQLGDLKGRRLCMLKTPKMCVAPDWLFSILAEGHYGPADRFFGSVVTDAKFSRVILPVFFGQADACLTSKQGFDTMCELNPQVARDLKVLASSPTILVDFYIFHKNYRGATREKVIRAISNLYKSESGRQIATLFQLHELAVLDASCLASALKILDAADRARGKAGVGGRKG